MNTLETKDKFVGCLLAGAVGDALCLPVEFLNFEEIRREFGPGCTRQYLPLVADLRTNGDCCLSHQYQQGMWPTKVPEMDKVQIAKKMQKPAKLCRRSNDRCQTKGRTGTFCFSGAAFFIRFSIAIFLI